MDPRHVEQMLYKLQTSDMNKKRIWDLNKQALQYIANSDWNSLKDLISSCDVQTPSEASPSLIQLIPQIFISVMKENN